MGEHSGEDVQWLGPWRYESPDRYARRCLHRGDVCDAVLYRFVNTADGTEKWRKGSLLIGGSAAHP